MAAPPPPSRDLNNAPYNDGGGQGYGKFRKRPLRRITRTTPYDRPPTTIRNPASGNIQRLGWLSKLVDPAQRLITSSAYRLFGSVFRKNLPPPPPPLQPVEHPELSGGDADKQPRESVSANCKDQLGKQEEAAGGCDNPNNSCSTSGVSELELILKQKTFTRSEIDHLTAVLLSRMPDGEEEKRSEIINSIATMPQNREEFQNTPSRDSGFGRNLLSAPMSDSRVLDEQVASPAEFAKAYMGSRPSMGSPSKKGFHNEPLKENSLAMINQTFTAKSPMTSVLPSSSRSARFPENGFVTPRSRGRTAIYNMARTPYTRVHQATDPQNSVTSGVFDELPSTSRNPQENNRFAGSKQGALKRRVSVLDSDMGSIGGPIRRIRQKSNLFSSSKTLPVRGAGYGPGVSHHPDSVERPILAGEGKPTRGNGDNKIHASGFNRVPSKSSEVASKILQQLDVLVTSREKSPAKLSPSMLSGPALRSLENVDSSKFLENFDIKHGNLLSDARDKQPQTVDKMEQNGLVQPITLLDRPASSIDGADSTNLVKKDVPSLKAVAAPAAETVSQSGLPKKRGFQMSAHEDFVELDDDSNQKGTLSVPFSDGEKLDNVLTENRTNAFDTVGVKKLPTLTESVITGKSSGSTGPVKSSSTTTAQQAMSDSRSTVLSDKAVLLGKSDTTPVFSFAEKVSPEKAQNHVSAMSNSTSTFNEAPLLKSSAVAVSELPGQKSGGLHGPKLDGLSSTPLFTGSSYSVGKETVLEKDDERSNIKASFSDRSPEPATSAVATSSSTANIFSFGIAAGSTLSNGSITSIPSLSATNQHLLSNKIGQNSPNSASITLASSTSDPIAISSSVENASSSGSFGTAVPAAPFKFGSSVVTPASVSPGGTFSTTTGTGGSIFGATSAVTSTGITSFTSTSIGVFSSGSALTNTRTGTDSAAPSAVTSSVFGTDNTTPSAIENAGSNGSAATTSPGIFSGASAVMSAPSTTFGFSTGVAVSTASNQSQSLNPFGAGSALNGFAASSQSMPLQSSASAPSPSVLAGNNTISFGSSVSSSSTSVATMFSPGAAFGLNSSSSSQSNSNSSSSSMTTSIFGSTWQGVKPLSGPALTSSSSSASNVFTFGAASTASSAASSTSGVFGSTINTSPFSSVNTTSSASLFSFSSPATNTQTQPLFSNPNPSFAFGSSPSSNGDQMTMEDSMAEDPVQASSPPAPIFGQQPTPGFAFGSTAPPAAGNQFGSTTPPGPSVFQFAGQSNPVTPQNTSLFQASGSFNGGSSFSLGTGGDDKSQRRIIKAKRHPRKK